jgi:5'-nucleotidase
MQDVIISNKEAYKEKKARMRMDGLKNLFVVSDFDRTLTKAKLKNKKISSMVALLREGNYLSDEYAQKAKNLFKKYHPFEIDMDISFEDKNSKMHEWWTKHNKLFVKYGLSKKIIQKIVHDRKVGLREGTKLFLKSLHLNNIPLFIISASSFGDIIDDYLVKNKSYYDNTKIITNFFEYDKNGMVTKSKDPVITTTNKFLAVNEFIFDFKGINGKKKNIMLLGDNHEDENMADTLYYEDILKVGFLNEEIDERVDDYKRVYDVVIINDGTMYFPNSFLKSLI